VGNKNERYKHGPFHNNGETTCAIRLKKRKNKHGEFELKQVVFVPMNHSYDVDQKKLIFAMDIDNDTPGRTSTDVAGYFLNWCQTNLKVDKLNCIQPLVWNWPKIRELLLDWLGEETYDSIFNDEGVVRDLQVLRVYCIDRADYWGDQAIYANNRLEEFLKKNGIHAVDKGNQIELAKNMIKIYKKMMHYKFTGY
jgi:hypothetical protein